MPWLIRPPDLPIYGFRKTSAADKIGNSGTVNTSRRSFTIACWMRRTGSLAGFETLLASNVAEYIELYINSATNDHLRVYSDSVGDVDTGFSVTASERWFYVAMTLSGSAQTGYLTYSPGKWDVTGSQGPATISATNSAFYFGGDTDGQAPPGDVACLRAWSRPLSSQELLTEMMSPNAASLQGLLFDVRDYSRANSASVPLQITHGTGGNSVKVSNKPLILPSLELPYYFSTGGGYNIGPTAFQGFQTNAFQGQGGYRQKDIARTAFQQNAFQENAFQIYGAPTGSSDTNVNTNSVSMTLTTHRATISFDRNIATTSVAMTLTPHKATISDDYNVSTTSVAMTLTTHKATITFDRNVTTTSVALHLTTHAATISFDKNVATSSVAMTLTPHAATITVGSNDIEVFANVVSLVLTPHRADISLVAPSTPPAETQGAGSGGRFELVNDDDEVIMAIIKEFLEKAA